MKIFLTRGWGVKSLILSSLVSIGLFAYEKFRDKPDLRVSVESIENIIDLKEDMADLQILYKNKPLIRDGQTIKIVQVKIENYGKSILNEYYETSRDFYFLLENSVILTIGAVDSNEKYLADSIICSSSAIGKSHIEDIGFEKPPSRICLSKVIFDSDKFVRFKLYILQNINEQFSIALKGKISGVDENNFPVSYPSPPDSVEGGGLFGSLKKFGKYFGIIYLFVLGLGIPSVVITDRIDRKRRRELIELFMKEHLNENFAQSPFINFYIENGISNTLKIIIDEVVTKGKGYVPVEQFLPRDLNSFSITFLSIRTKQGSAIFSLQQASLIEIKDGMITFTPEFQKLVVKFMKFGIDHGLKFEPLEKSKIPPPFA